MEEEEEDFCVAATMHHFAPAIANTDGAVYNVIITLLLEYDGDNPTPEFMVWDYSEGEMEGDEEEDHKKRGGITMNNNAASES